MDVVELGHAINLPDCVVNISKSSSSSVVAIIADSVVVDSNACLSCLPQSAGNVGLVVSIFGVVTVVEPKTKHSVTKMLLQQHVGESDSDEIVMVVTEFQFW